ncbi:MAG TPA: hypothetical protein VIG88_04490 [Lysobacter sp.]
MPRSASIPHARPNRVLGAALVATLPVVACTGCNVLGAVFDERPLAGIAFVVLVVAAVGFLVSRGARRR